jgi:hypothetical protein
MRQTPLSSNRVETGRRFRLFPRSACVLVWQLVFVWIASNAPAQSGFLASPRELLAMDPRAFAEWLDSNRPKPMAEDERARIFGSLPRQGRRTHFDAAGRQKLAGMQAFLRAAGHDSTYEILVVEAPQLRIGVYARRVILVPEPALNLLDVAELDAQLAHETGHAYLWGDDAPASEMNNRRAKDLELLCDAIALATLHRLRLDPSRLMTGIEKITRYNWKFDKNVDEGNYPTLAERRRYARDVSAWLKRGSRPSNGSRETPVAESRVRS